MPSIKSVVSVSDRSTHSLIGQTPHPYSIELTRSWYESECAAVEVLPDSTPAGKAEDNVGAPLPSFIFAFISRAKGTIDAL
jgi:hypothetical protein